MTVYDEYVKTHNGPEGGEDGGPATTNGTENVDPAGEEGKEAE